MTNIGQMDSFRKPERLLDFAELKENEKVLDIATGFGHLSRHIALRTKTFVDAQNGSEWKEFLESMGIHAVVNEMEQNNIRHVFAPMEDPALSQVGAYDVIFFQNSIFMPVNHRKFFRSIRRALKPGGRFLLVGQKASEEAVARGELAANGFVVVKSTNMFQPQTDDQNTSAWSNLHDADRFVLLCEEAI